LVEETFTRSNIADAVAQPDTEIATLYRQLLDLRRREIVPRLTGPHAFSARHDARERSLAVNWTLADGSRLRLIANLSNAPSAAIEKPLARLIWGGTPGDTLPPWSIIWSSES
jgi:maltooligosyltrehalose trehalohydrolase